MFVVKNDTMDLVMTARREKDRNPGDDTVSNLEDLNIRGGFSIGSFYSNTLSKQHY